MSHSFFLYCGFNGQYLFTLVVVYLSFYFSSFFLQLPACGTLCILVFVFVVLNIHCIKWLWTTDGEKV